MRTHVTIVGAWFILSSVFSLVASGACFFFAVTTDLGGPREAEALRTVLGVSGVSTLLASLFFMLLANGMFRLKNWARIVTIILGALYVPSLGFPIGVYFLWVCLSQRGASLFREAGRVKLYKDDEPRTYVRQRGPDSGPPEAEVPAESAYPSGGCLVLLVLLALLVLVGLPVLWVSKGSEIQRLLDRRLQQSPTGPSAPDAQPPAPTQPEAAPPQPSDGAPPPPSRARTAEAVDGMPGYWSYTDERGTRHIVDDYKKVPARYRVR